MPKRWAAWTADYLQALDGNRRWARAESLAYAYKQASRAWRPPLFTPWTGPGAMPVPGTAPA